MNIKNAKNELFHLLFTVRRVNETIACDQGLFGPANKDFESLLDFAPEVFSVIQKSFTDRAATLFGKLLDKTKGTTSLPQWINNYVEKKSRGPYQAELKEIEKDARRILAIRNNGVSHTNREYVNGHSVLEPASHSELADLAVRIHALLEKLRLRYFPDTGYSITTEMPDHVLAMMTKIKSVSNDDN